MTQLFQHPTYRRMFDEWEIYKELYDGVEEIIRTQKYTPKFVCEETDDGKKAYTARLNRTFYTNLLEPIISIWLGWLFQKPPSIDAVVEIFDGDEENIDGFGTDLNEFLYEMGKNYLLYGATYLTVDAPNVESASKLADQALGKRPYCRLFNPLEVPDWIESTANYSTYGALTEVNFQWPALKDRTSTKTKPEEMFLRRILSLSNTGVVSELYRAEHKSVNENDRDRGQQQALLTLRNEDIDWTLHRPVGAIDIDELPVIRCLSESWIKDIVPELRRRHQLVCSYENILHYQAYKKTFIFGEPISDSPKNMSENAVMFFKAGGSVYESTAEDPAALEKRIEAVTETIFKIALHQLRQIPGTSKMVQSDSTIREEKEPQIAAAKTAICELEYIANGMVRLWAKFRSKKKYDPKKHVISFNKEFTLQHVDELSKQWAVFRDEIAQVDSWRKALLKKISAKQEYTKEELEKIFAEIDGLKANKPKEEPPARKYA